MAAEPRLRATPYARRLARERAIPLAAVAGSGPGGRIVALDLEGWRAPNMTVEPTAQPQPEPAPAAVAAPSALAARIDFAAVEGLLARVAEVRPGISGSDVALKAAALALAALPRPSPDAILLLSPPEPARRLAGLATAPLGAIATMRAAPGEKGEAGLAVSFLARGGLRPVAARLPDGIAARLVVGLADADGMAECLLSYDPDRLADAEAETLLAAFAELVETPLRLLV